MMLIKKPGSYVYQIVWLWLIKLKHLYVSLFICLLYKIACPGYGDPVAWIVCHGLGSFKGFQFIDGDHSSINKMMVGWEPLGHLHWDLSQNLNDSKNSVSERMKQSIYLYMLSHYHTNLTTVLLISLLYLSSPGQ